MLILQRAKHQCVLLQIGHTVFHHFPHKDRVGIGIFSNEIWCRSYRVGGEEGGATKWWAKATSSRKTAKWHPLSHSQTLNWIGSQARSADQGSGDLVLH